MTDLPFYIAPSILAADFARLGDEVKNVLQAGADVIHFDVMDNHYVPNLTMGAMVCKSLRDYGISAAIDVHLMTRPVDELIVSFAKAGASYISFHPEASDHVDRSLQLIRSFGVKAGLALNPATALTTIEFVLDKIDLLLLMSVNPGFGGQQFIPTTLRKIALARDLIADCTHEIRLEVDGGINVDNIAAVAAAGANMFVAGSAIFSSDDYASTIAAMRAQLAKCTQHEALS